MSEREVDQAFFLIITLAFGLFFTVIRSLQPVESETSESTRTPYSVGETSTKNSRPLKPIRKSSAPGGTVFRRSRDNLDTPAAHRYRFRPKRFTQRDRVISQQAVDEGIRTGRYYRISETRYGVHGRPGLIVHFRQGLGWILEDIS